MMATPTYDLLASSVLTSTTTSVTLSSISQGYRDLILISNIAINASEGNFTLRFNADSGSNYTGVTAEADKNGNITSVSYGPFSRFFETRNDGTLNQTRSVVTTQIMDYSATNKHKTALIRAGNAGGLLGIAMTAGRYASTSAITSMEIFADGATINSGSSFYLYGIAG